jgi:hypothetical protein
VRLVILSYLLLIAGPLPARAQAVAFGPHDVRSAFYVAKSENRNQVHYAVRVDPECRPLGARPVFAYWQRLREGKRVDEPLVGLGTRFYGASDEQRVSPGRTGGQVDIFVKALPRLHIQIAIEKTDRGCRAVAFTSIAGARARLSHAFLQLARLKLKLKYVELVGERLDGTGVTERID